jgi:hypothetical protein
VHGGSPFAPIVVDERDGVSGTVTAGRLSVVEVDVGELGSAPVVGVVPVPIVLGDDPNPDDGVMPGVDDRLDGIDRLDGLDRLEGLERLDGLDRVDGSDRLDCPDMPGEARVLEDRPEENPVLDGADPIEPVLRDDVDIEEEPRVDVVKLEPAVNVPDVGEVILLVEVGAPNVVLEMVGSQGPWGVVIVPAGPVCIDVDG